MKDERRLLTADEVEQLVDLLVELADDEDPTTSDEELWRLALTEDELTVLRRVVAP